jgi:dTDP-4-amino-4,6-dideoxygalactose transaminase
MSTAITEAVRFLPFHTPLIEQEDVDAVAEVVKSGWLTSGPKVEEFEKGFARYLGARHAVAVNSCTAALHLALEAIGLSEGDEVLLPTLTFTATAEVVTYSRAKPVLVDSEPCYFNLDCDQLERHITRRTRAIIPVHLAGHPCEMSHILEFARQRSLHVIEDAAHAFPAKYHDRFVGTLSPLTAFSFYATKTLTTGEGGMVTTDDDAFASRIRTMRLHGMSRDAWKRYSSEGTWRYEVIEAGYKYNLTDMQAALGLAQLAKTERMLQKRAQIAQFYTQGLKDCAAFCLPRISPSVQHAWHLYVILVRPENLTISRDQLIEELRHRGIGTAVHFIPLHLHSYYQRNWGYCNGQFPVAERYFNRCLSLPLYPAMTQEDAERVVDSLHDIAYNFRA